MSASRIDYPAFKNIASGVTAGLTTMGQAISGSGLEKGLIELLKVRASQINNCAFCVQFHLTQARAAQLSPTKLDLVAVWREAGVYAPREIAALAWTEALTRVATVEPEESVYANLQAEFSENEIAHLTAAIGHINAWNRIAAGLRFTPIISVGTSS